MSLSEEEIFYEIDHILADFRSGKEEFARNTDPLYAAMLTVKQLRKKYKSLITKNCMEHITNPYLRQQWSLTDER